MKLHFAKANFTVPAAILLALATVGCVSSSAYEKLENDYKESQARAQELEAANKELNDRIAELSDELKAREAEIAELKEKEGESAASSEEMQALLAEKARLERELAALQAGKREMNQTYSGLADALKAELEEGNIKISQVEGMVVLTVEDGVFFDSGSATVNARGRDLLDRLANALKDVPDHRLVIEGYTDNRRIGPRLRKTYKSNWELGAARAINVVRYLNSEAGVPADRMSAQTFGEHGGPGDNTTEEGRAKNRRIQISVISVQKTDAVEEQPETTESAEDATEEAAEETEATNEEMEPIESVETEETTDETTDTEMESGEENAEDGEAMEAEQPAENVQ